MTKATGLDAASSATIAPEDVCIPLLHVDPPSLVKRTSKDPFGSATASQPWIAVAKRIETISPLRSVVHVWPPSLVRLRSVGQLRTGLGAGVEEHASVSAQATRPSMAWICTTGSPLTPSSGTTTPFCQA